MFPEYFLPVCEHLSQLRACQLTLGGRESLFGEIELSLARIASRKVSNTLVEERPAVLLPVLLDRELLEGSVLVDHE